MIVPLTDAPQIGSDRLIRGPRKCNRRYSKSVFVVTPAVGIRLLPLLG